MRDSSDGAALLAVVHYYCPEQVKLDGECRRGRGSAWRAAGGGELRGADAWPVGAPARQSAVTRAGTRASVGDRPEGGQGLAADERLPALGHVERSPQGLGHPRPPRSLACGAGPWGT
ncbi:hypothetical protein J0S82_018155 [Galemys pyrenaicus]|uniref:CASAMP second calponin-homology domain-containing protein n=1 Tax=Galemys pyrenaicus TaxID=202257 RepID=A0A8J6DS13_GALPY|nr:hypothetical protein J0S82_018155 [Galemys pyrenaicus]